MAKTFDSATKQLVEAHPADWIAFAGLPPGNSVRVVDADLSSFTLAADKVILVDGPSPYIAHFEFQSGIDPELDRRILMYNVVLRWRHGLPVRSVVVLLRPQALSASVTGRVRDVEWPENRLEFEYKLVRVWEISADALLAGGPGTLPLAPIGAVTEDSLPQVIKKMERRLAEEAPTEVKELETASFLLMGLRYSRELVDRLLKEVRNMKDSVTYQIIFEEGEAKGVAKGKAEGIAEGIAEGKIEGERAAILRIGRKRLGPPSAQIVAALEAITDVQVLEKMVDRSIDANSWEEILA